MKELLTNASINHWRLKRFIKDAYYCYILFQKKGFINEDIVDLDVNSFYAIDMRTKNIPKGKPKEIMSLNNVSTFIIEVEHGLLKPIY
jgi:hypothetical protein